MIEQPMKRLPFREWKDDEVNNRDQQPNYYRQNGLIYGWSESNFTYEYAWYLYSNSVLARTLQEERPLPEGYTI